MINCRICNQDVEPDNYNKSAYKCRPCAAEYRKKYYTANKDRLLEKNRARYENKKAEYLPRMRDASIKRRFGISEKEYDEWRATAKQCEICLGPFEKGPELDHCHTTGKLRGWLCGKCNRVLGLVNDNQTVLEEAIKYLEKHASK